MKKKHYKILRGINMQAWDKYGKDLMVEKQIAPDVKKVFQRAVKNPKKHGLNKKEKERAKNILNSGYLDQTHSEEDPDVAKKMSEFTEKRIQEEIKKGNLPKRETDKDYKKYNKKLKQYANRIKKENIKKSSGASSGGKVSK